MTAQFVVENGTGLETANSYESVVNADQYHLDRGNSSWTNASLANRETALVRATDYIDIHRIINENLPLTSTQALKFPIVGIGVPTKVKYACCEYALEALTRSLQPTPEYEPQKLQSSKRKIGPLEKEDRYSTFGGIATKAEFPKGDRLLAPFVLSARRTIT